MAERLFNIREEGSYSWHCNNITKEVRNISLFLKIFSPNQQVKEKRMVNSTGEIKIRQGFELRTKFLAILFLLFVLFAANLIITNNIIGTQQQDTLLINLAGRQRMISERILKLVSQLLLYRTGATGETVFKDMMSSRQFLRQDNRPLSEKEGLPVENSGTRIRKEIDEEVNLFEMTLNAFMEGGKTPDSAGKIVYIQRVESEKAQKALEEIHGKWQELIKNVYSIALNNLSSKKSEKIVTLAFKRLEELGLLLSINMVVSILEKEAQGRVELLRNIQILTLPFGLLFFLIAIIYLQIAILKPIKNLVNTVMKGIKGDTKKRADVISKDEIGFLAGSYNTMMDNLDQTTVSMDFLESVVHAIYESLIVTDRDRNIVLVNPATKDMLGIKSDREIIGRKLDEFSARSTKKRNNSLFNPDSFERLLKYGFIKNYNLNFQAKGGDVIPVSFSASTLTSSDGGFEGLVCVAKDMREYNMLQSQLVQSSKLAALGTMSASMAHELKNPLTIVKGKAQFVIHQFEDGKKPEPRSLIKDMNDIETSADRMTVIINHLKDFSRESKDEDWKYLDIKQVIEDSLLFLTKELNKKDITIVMEIAAGLPAVWGDHNKLISVFQNLVANAADAFEYINDNRKRFINISAPLIKSNEIIIMVEDNGSGIEKDELGYIFNPFFTTKSIGKGTGLGLSILYRIIEEHNGAVDVTSVLGKGTVFKVSFPTEGANQNNISTGKK